MCKIIKYKRKFHTPDLNQEVPGGVPGYLTGMDLPWKKQLQMKNNC